MQVIIVLSYSKKQILDFIPMASGEEESQVFMRWVEIHEKPRSKDDPGFGGARAYAKDRDGYFRVDTLRRSYQLKILNVQFI